MPPLYYIVSPRKTYDVVENILREEISVERDREINNERDIKKENRRNREREKKYPCQTRERGLTGGGQRERKRDEKRP